MLKDTLPGRAVPFTALHGLRRRLTTQGLKYFIDVCCATVALACMSKSSSLQLLRCLFCQCGVYIMTARLLCKTGRVLLYLRQTAAAQQLRPSSHVCFGCYIL
jgi:hypothetical protein